ncbi:unnamed protein product [Clonostachys byssicola]|uniref:Uncharacterized protein n=1 Tax=Clonostachys byssicola TaxID=160290 RepID=A0A9N9U841_9HYPO|nr:unnamed protein product [Clonostachys byssicola]
MEARHQAVSTKEAPIPRAPLSQAIIHPNGMIFCSGALGQDPTTHRIVEGPIGDRTKQALKNLSAVLEAANSSLEHVIKVNIFMTSMSDISAVNQVYERFFVWNPLPARTCVAVKELPNATDIEIEAVAYP